MSRWVLVDDTDSSIIYTGPWSPDMGNLDPFGNNGPTCLHTLHGINAPGSFSYTFRGSQVLIVGTVQFLTSGNVTNPSWRCIVDGEPTVSILYTKGADRLRLCEKDGLDEEAHVITVTVDVSTNRTFWLDYIQYIPSPYTPLDTAALEIDTADPEIQQALMGTWTQKDLGYYTLQKDVNFRFEFFEQDTPVQYNQIFFQTPQLEAKTHTIEVSFQGDASKTPLSLYILQIQNGTSTTTSSSTQSSLSNAPSSTNGLGGATDNKPSRDRTPAFLGGILGGIAVLLLVGVLALFLRKRRKRRGNYITGAPSQDLSPRTAEIIHPFPLSPAIRPSNTTSPAYDVPHDPKKLGSSLSRSEPPLVPLRRREDHATGLPVTTHAPLSSPSANRSDQDRATVPRDIDSGLRFRTTDSTTLQPPVYTAL
ncbi:hypothetical protein CPC08DRAFT_752117 [Agrocybe pediades]|nr:hypothetical protein CPC08DRAFT_752117 [Agrocybe pediades]